jgi:hypothetical protein
VSEYGHRYVNDPNAVGERTLLARTCPDCGLLLDASWFGRTQWTTPRRGYMRTPVWRAKCTKCRQRQAGPRTNQSRSAEDRDAYREHMQALTRARATRDGFPYTESDYVILANPNLTNLAKAYTLRRTYVAIVTAVRRGGWVSRVEGRRDVAEGQWLIDFPEVAASVIHAVNEPASPEPFNLHDLDAVLTEFGINVEDETSTTNAQLPKENA